MRDHIFLGISVEQGRGAGPGRGRGGLADRRRGLRPPARGGRPAGAVRGGADDLLGRRAHVAHGRAAPSTRSSGAPPLRPATDEATVHGRDLEQLRSAGFRQSSPLGFEITPDLEDEVRADPTGMPSSFQTPEKKAELIGAVGSTKPGERHRALIQLAGWDEDDEVATALRPLLQSDDVFEASQAANGLARQADVTDLPALVDLVRRMSPSDGGTCEAMLLVLPARARPGEDGRSRGARRPPPARPPVARRASQHARSPGTRTPTGRSTPCSIARRRTPSRAQARSAASASSRCSSR